jgi:hypothetical protein
MVSKIPTATGVIGHDINWAWYIMMAGYVSVLALV